MAFSDGILTKVRLECLVSQIAFFAQVQDEAAGLVVAMLDPQPGEAILDACAAPGGKTLFAAARMQNQVSTHTLIMTWPLSLMLFVESVDVLP